MERLFSPWRSLYIESFKTETRKTGVPESGVSESGVSKNGPDEKRCVFCEALAANDDEKSMIVFRGVTVFVIMNLFPYNSGHLLIIPKRHTSDFLSLSDEESMECQLLLQASHRALAATIKPHAFNLGMNLGRIAGAGIEDHLHWHIVPRWNGDTNFLPVLADVKLVSEDMHKLWKTLSEQFPEFVGKT